MNLHDHVVPIYQVYLQKFDLNNLNQLTDHEQYNNH